MSRPIVAIVGRPNVGKSTLFNRLVGRFQAIVDDAPGTTRDRIYADTSWRDREMTLVDTGGLEMQGVSGLTSSVRAQVQIAIAEADAIVFVVDGRDGVLPPDEDVAQQLRRSGKPVVLAVNKMDSTRLEAGVSEFYRLGLGEPVPVSAYHARGTGDLLEQVIARLPPPSPEEPTAPDLARIAIVGRPNVGKSSLLNAILGQERAIVSEVPGTTRDALDIEFQHKEQRLVLVDTAGIRRRGRIGTGVDRWGTLRSLRAIAHAHVAILVMEAPEGVTAQDAHVASYALDACTGLVLAMNKWDLVPDRDEVAHRAAARAKLRFIPYAPLVFMSATQGQGVQSVLDKACQLYQERSQRIPTAQVNRVLREATVAQFPPAVDGKPIRFLYATQAQANPPTFVVFVSRGPVHFSYHRYLENYFRQSFGFSQIPLRLIFRIRERNEAA